jgi:putative protein kinase ArgK-like GTPase of G3E family
MASVGQTSRQAPQPLQRPSTTAGRGGAGMSALVGQVIKHCPQAGHRWSVTTVVTGSPSV